MVVFQLSGHYLEHGPVQIPKTGADVRLWEYGLPHPQSVRIEQAFNSCFKYLCVLRVKNPQVAVIQDLS